MNWKRFLEKIPKDKIAFVFMVIGAIIILLSTGLYMFFTFFSLIISLVLGLIAIVGAFLTLKRSKLGSVIAISASVPTLLLAILFNIAVRISPLYSFSEILPFNIILFGPVFVLLGGILRIVRKKTVTTIVLMAAFFIVLVFVFMPLQSKMNGIIQNNAIVNKDLSKCNFMFPLPDPQAANWQKYNCYLKIAKEKKNPKICEEIPIKYIYYRGYTDKYGAKYYTDSSLKDGCYFEIVAETLDPKLCKKISKPDTCYLFIARATKNISMCNNIKDNWYRDRCLEIKPE